MPLPSHRLEVLRLATQALPLSPSVDLNAVNIRCHAFLFADMITLARDAFALSVAARGSPFLSLLSPFFSRSGPQQSSLVLTAKSVEPAHFFEARQHFSVSSVRGNTSVQQIEKVSWLDIGGLEEVKVDFSVFRCYFFPSWGKAIPMTCILRNLVQT